MLLLVMKFLVTVFLRYILLMDEDLMACYLFIYLIFEARFLCSFEPVLELALVDQAGHKLIETCLLLPHVC